MGYIYYLPTLQKLFEMRSALGSALLGMLLHIEWQNSVLAFQLIQENVVG